MIVINYGRTAKVKGKQVVKKEFRWELEDDKYEALKKTGLGLYPYKVHSIEHYPGSIADNM